MPQDSKEDIRTALLEAGYSPRTATNAMDKASSVKECLRWCWTNVGIRFGTLRHGRFKGVVDELEYECEHLILQSEKVAFKQSNQVPSANSVSVEETQEEKEDKESKAHLLQSIGIVFCLQILAAAVVAGIIFIPGEWRQCGTCKGRQNTLRYIPSDCEFKPCEPGQLDSNLWIFFLLWGINMILVILMAVLGFFISHGRVLAFLDVGIVAQGVWTIVLVSVLGLTYGVLYMAGPDNVCRSPIELPYRATAIPYPCEHSDLSWLGWVGVGTVMVLISGGLCIACCMSLRAFRAFLAHE